MFTAIFTFPQERAMLSKERAADMYRLSAYFVARTTSDLPLDLMLPVLFLLVVYFMAGLRMNVNAFVLTQATVFLCIIAAQVCGVSPLSNELMMLFIVHRIRNSHLRLIKHVYVMTGIGASYWCYTYGLKEGDYTGFCNSNDLHAGRRILCEGKY